MFQHAISIVESFKAENGLVGLLETLQYMRDNPDSMTEKESWAYRIVCNEMSKLFAPV